MGGAPPAPGPVGGRERLVALDATRGVAVLGILLMNIWAFAGPQAWFDYPASVAGRGGAPVATWAVVHTLFEGSQRALFSMLFGAGMLMLVTRLESRDPGPGPAWIYYRRVALLVVIGLVDAFVLLWPADILVTYGLCGLLLYPLRRLGARALLACALAVFALQAGVRVSGWLEDIRAEQAYREAATLQREGVAVNPALAKLAASWERTLERTRPDPASPRVRESMRIMQSGGLAEFYRERARTSLVLQTVVLVNSWFLDALGGMLLGMMLYRSGWLAARRPARDCLLLAAAGYGVGLPLSGWETITLIGADFDPILHARHLVHYDLRRVAVALGHLGTILWFCQVAPGSWLTARLASVGRMALSNYLGQSVLCGLVFYPVGLGLYGRFTGYYLYLVVLAVWIIQVALSGWWLASHRFGPAEWLWRWLTYGRRPPMRYPSAA